MLKWGKGKEWHACCTTKHFKRMALSEITIFVLSSFLTRNRDFKTYDAPEFESDLWILFVWRLRELRCLYLWGHPSSLHLNLYSQLPLWSGVLLSLGTVVVAVSSPCTLFLLDVLPVLSPLGSDKFLLLIPVDDSPGDVLSVLFGKTTLQNDLSSEFFSFPGSMLFSCYRQRLKPRHN